jgi:O-antigen/teichoic acid export membrane protein
MTDDVGWLIIPAMILLIVEGFQNAKSALDYVPDERERSDRQKSIGAYFTSVGMAAIFGALLLSFQDMFSSMWVPRSHDDWQAIFWLLITTGVGSQMISERKRALLPLDDDSIEVELLG